MYIDKSEKIIRAMSGSSQSCRPYCLKLAGGCCQVRELSASVKEDGEKFTAALGYNGADVHAPPTDVGQGVLPLTRLMVGDFSDCSE